MTAHGRNEAISFTIPRAMLGAHAEALDALAMQRVSDPVVHRLVAPALARIGEAIQHGELGQADADYGELVVSLARTLAVDRHGRRSEALPGGGRDDARRGRCCTLPAWFTECGASSGV